MTELICYNAADDLLHAIVSLTNLFIKSDQTAKKCFYDRNNVIPFGETCVRVRQR